MSHFGLAPAAPFAIAVIVLELGASALILNLTPEVDFVADVVERRPKGVTMKSVMALS
jgi:hypothetical protein